METTGKRQSPEPVLPKPALTAQAWGPCCQGTVIRSRTNSTGLWSTILFFFTFFLLKEPLRNKSLYFFLAGYLKAQSTGDTGSE